MRSRIAELYHQHRISHRHRTQSPFDHSHGSRVNQPPQSPRPARTACCSTALGSS